ncbi:MAG: CapA family protein [Muribaculaceae bacterium]|nr:CapA family protein [Muribaculaceae bacterium]
MPFFVTFTFAVLAGLFLLFAYLWIATDTRPVYHQFQLTKETVPAEEEVQEIIRQNDKYEDILQDESYMAKNNIYAKETAEEDCVTITFAGDILFDPNYAIMATLQQRGGDISEGIEADLIEEMKSADIMMLNNEFPYSDRGTPTEEKAFTFRAPTSYVSYLEDLGVDIVALANNHAYDYGEEAFLDTLQTLRDADVPYVGAGVDLEEASAPVYFIANNTKIAFLAATQIERLENPDTKGATETTPGVFRCWDPAKLLETVAETKENCDFLIVYVHWGTENQEETDWAQDKQALQLVEAGADLIIGDHPHILQKIDIIEDVPVIYSLGNFWFNSRTIDTGMVKVILSEGKLQSFQFIPCLQSGCRTVLLEGEEKKEALDKMQELSKDVQIDEEGFVSALPGFVTAND